MHSLKPAVTLRDKKKAKNTIKLFGGFAVFFTLGTVLSAVFMPRAKTLNGINNDEVKIIKNLVSVNYGEQYCAISGDTFQLYDTRTNKLLNSISYVDVIANKLSEDGISYNPKLFSDPTSHYENLAEGQGFLLMFDNFGNTFKFNYSQENNFGFTLDDSYFLTDSYTLTEDGQDVTYSNQYSVRTLYYEDGNIYILGVNNNKYVVDILDTNDLSRGFIDSKNLYKFSKPDDNQIDEIEKAYKERVKNVLGLEENLRYSKTPFYVMDPISAGSNNGESPYNIFKNGNYLYILSSSGVHKWYVDPVKGFNDFYDIELGEINVYDESMHHYIEEMRAKLLATDETTRAKYGIKKDLYDSLGIASNYVISSLYKIVFEDTYLQDLKQYAAEFTRDTEWMAYYNPNTSYLSHAVFEEYFDEDVYTVFVDKGASNTLDGMVYSPINKEVFFINDKNNYLYSISVDEINNFEFLGDISLIDKSTRTDINFGKKQFFDNHTAISYDPNVNSLHVLFQNDKDLCVIDLTEEGPVKRHQFSSRYDIAGFNETVDRKKIVILYKTDKVTIHNVASNPYHVDVINPDAYKHRGIFIALTIICAVFLAASVITVLMALKAFKKDKTMLKMKVIKRDLKRNKWTYVALIPFIVLLIMFCYVEAVGSISFSFFSYTMEHPSYIWNDFGNYISIFHDADFWLMFGNTFFFLVFDLFLGIVPPIIFAFCLSVIKNKKLSGTLRALMFIPAIVPGIATLLIWRFGIFGNTGVLNQLVCLLRTGHTSSPDFTPIEFLIDPDISRWALLLMGFPYVGGYLIFYGGLMNIPKEYDEACQLEGLGVVKRFFKIDLPLITPQIKYIFVMGILSSAQNYERTYMLGSTGTVTLVESMYRQMKDYSNYGMASAYATIIFLLLLVPVLINFKDTRKNNLGDQI